MRLYTVSLCDDLLEYPMLDGRVYLTKYDAQRRADRMTYEDDLCRHWATVEPVECMWDTDAKGPFDDYKSDWMRFIDYATGIKRDRDRARAENAKLRELVRDMWGVMWACAEQRCTHRHEGCFRVHGNHGDICASESCWYEDRMRELGIEGTS